jgi:ubiquinone/menaquinone biosynthesis C-methylase UbiE
MPDVYATITEADRTTLEGLVEILELRAADPMQRTLLEDYTSDLELPAGARVLEVGCGTGAVTRYLAGLPGAGPVVGADPSPFFVERAGELAHAAGLEVDFVVADGRDLPFDDESFDAVVFHTSLSHIPEPELALAQACRVLRPRGRLAVFDGDYVTVTVATHAGDPLQACADAAVASLVHDPWLMRRIGALVAASGFEDCRVQGHAYTSTDAEYLQSLVGRGADILAGSGEVTDAEAEELKAEARSRREAGTFFGHIAYVSALAGRP